ncbi:MAG TPA: type VI secretion system-associated protein TagF [Steroidobacteraceae bacterium]|nr:type VI secretion system-associated protein TagF [Steroidobacteraceae bacterium]
MDVGLYGKLPSHGDFLRRRVSDSFVGAWDAWLQQSVAASHAALGERWLDVYLTSPVWRFAAAAGVLGHGPVAGVMTPSVDRVGRYFPLAVVSEGPWDPETIPTPLAIAVRAGHWFDEVERLLLAAVGADHPDFDDLDARIARTVTLLEPLARPEPVALDEEDARAAAEAAADGWCLPLASAGALEALAVQLAGARLATLHAPLLLWWTDGSTLVAPCCLVTRGLPHPESFAAFLDGDWHRGAGLRVARASVTEAAAAIATLADDGPVHYESAARSDRGPVRTVNQDAFLERAEIGCWAVADGMGGHEHGEIASRMVCDALASLTPGATLEAMANDVRDALQQVNAQLRRGATGGTSGTTAVILLTRGLQWQVLWAGDSRLYRLRAGALEQLTDDHTLQPAGAAADDGDAYAITRAVGGDVVLELDAHRGRVQPGDRFVLCSDGLTRVLDAARIAELAGAGPAAVAADALLAAALAAHTTDNVTVIVVVAD